MESVLEVVFGLLLVMAVLVALAQRIKIPYPILLVIGGLAIGFVPGLPKVELDPELVFVLFLPPIILQAAYFTPIRDFRANLRPILFLSVGLVIATTVVVGLITHYFLGLSWPVAFVLGAIVSPPDAAAATSVMEHLKLPRRIVTILEGESLVNDASSLVLYKVGVAAAVTGVFSFTDTVVSFFVSSIGGILLGLVIGWIAVRFSRRFMAVDSVFILLGFLFGFGAYLLGEAIGVSGVLADVALGLYLGRNMSQLQSPQLRITTESVWNLVIFLFNGLIFILIGLQLRNVLDGLRTEDSFMDLIGKAALLCITVIVVRFVWVIPAIYLPRYFSAKIRARDPNPPFWVAIIIGWTGMRGIVSLASALSLPLLTSQNVEFPDRDLVTFLTFSVILVTLVLQGLSLPVIIRVLKIPQDNKAEDEVKLARRTAAEAGRDHLQELSGDERITPEVFTKLIHMYDKRVAKIQAIQEGNIDNPKVQLFNNMQQLQQELLLAELTAVIRLRDTGTINDTTLRVVQREFDLQQWQIDSATGRTS